MEKLDNKPLFSIVAIMKNEINTLPTLFSSLQEYLARGGEVVILDTGSTDGSAELARSLGATVHEVGEKFITVINSQLAGAINKEFVVEGEEDIVKAGNRLFDFAAARNYVSSLASNDFIVTLDCDEKYTTFNIDALNDLIRQGYEQFEYNFVYAHDAAGNPAVQFIQSKAFDRRKLKWVNKVHEVLQGDAKRIFVDSNVIMLEHFQEPFKDHRSNYLTGLGVDSYENPGNDRNLFYCAREMMYHGRPKSAIKAFMRHEKLQGWDAERGQNLIYTGDCYGTLNEPEKQLEYYHKGFDAYPKRREALIRIASYYRHRNNPHATAAYANAALVIPQTGFYADAMNEYRETPHELLSWACGQIGDIEAAKFHLMRCLDYIPNNRKYLEDTKLYFPYWEKFIEGWTSFRELLWLYTRATEMTSILEIGSWCGRSGNALLSGCKGKVTCVDTFKGTDDVNDLTYKQGENNSVYEKFMNTNGHFENLEVLKMSSKEAFEVLKDRKFDMIFVDANHTYEGVKEDIEMYQGLATKIFCGHDYTYPWLGVKAAVDECVGPVGLEDSIWYKYV